MPTRTSPANSVAGLIDVLDSLGAQAHTRGLAREHSDQAEAHLEAADLAGPAAAAMRELTEQNSGTNVLTGRDRGTSLHSDLLSHELAKYLIA